MNEINPSVMLAMAFVFGACIGSFLNVCIYRMPLEKSVVFPASHCQACSTVLPWYDNLPLLSYLIRRGHCGFCGAHFSARYFFVELLTGLMAVAVMSHFGLTLVGVGYFAFVAALIVITFIDLDHQIIPDVISLPGIIVGLLFSLLSPLPTLTIWTSLLGALAGAGFLLAVALGYQAVTGREGMGGGDVKLLAMIGAFLGWPLMLLTLVLASFSGSAVGLALMAARLAGGKTALPFGTFLAVGAIVAAVAGDDLLAWYVSFYQ